MNEQLLQFIWQFQYYNKGELETKGGESIKVINPGTWNHNQGPDFMDAKICINNVLLAGTVEVHVQSTDWEKHHHDGDRNYRNVVLHVVWKDDGHQGNRPVLELMERVPKLLLSRYEELMNARAFIPCEKNIATVNELILGSWKDRLLAERLLNKAQTIKALLEQNNYHWEETFWWLIARNFGIKINANVFEAVAKSIPLKVIARHRHSLFNLEALLLGQAGLLNREFQDEYPNRLKIEYHYQQFKKALNHVFKGVPAFLRLRPGSFPTLRLAQLAVLFHGSEHFFSKIKEESSLKAVKSLFMVTASEYWDTHYVFDAPSRFSKKTTGAVLVESIIINTIAPLLFYYGLYYGDASCKDKAVQWLEETAAEVNTVTKGFKQMGIIAQNAFESQALLELKLSYCDHRRCLDCAVGNHLLARSGKN